MTLALESPQLPLAGRVKEWVNLDEREPPTERAKAPSHVWRDIEEMKLDRMAPQLKLKVPSDVALTVDPFHARQAGDTLTLPIVPGAKLFKDVREPKAAASGDAPTSGDAPATSAME